MKKTALIFLALIWSSFAFSHCEVPCGIFNDEHRFHEIEEHLTTVEKAMDQIVALSENYAQNANQITRWIMNKEEHAEKIQHILSQYFLHQRIKPADKDNKEAYQKYIDQLTMVHQLMINAMKSKQTTDKTWVEKSRELLKKAKESYMAK